MMRTWSQAEPPLQPYRLGGQVLQAGAGLLPQQQQLLKLVSGHQQLMLPASKVQPTHCCISETADSCTQSGCDVLGNDSRLPESACDVAYSLVRVSMHARAACSAAAALRRGCPVSEAGYWHRSACWISM